MYKKSNNLKTIKNSLKMCSLLFHRVYKCVWTLLKMPEMSWLIGCVTHKKYVGHFIAYCYL